MRAGQVCIEALGGYISPSYTYICMALWTIYPHRSMSNPARGKSSASKAQETDTYMVHGRKVSVGIKWYNYRRLASGR